MKHYTSIPNELDQLRNPCSFLIAFECVTHGDAPYPGVPLPLANGTPAPLVGERARYTGLSCGTNWSVRLAGLLGESGRDQTLPAEHYGPSATLPALCTLWEDATKYLRVLANFTQQRLEVWETDSIVPLITLAFPTTGIAPRMYYFLRSSPILLAMTKSGFTYTLHASVGGTPVITASGTSAVDVRPTEIRFGDENMDNAENMEWFGGRVDEDATLTAAEATASLQDLDFFAT